MGTGENERGLGTGSETAESTGNYAEQADSSSIPPSPPSRQERSLRPRLSPIHSRAAYILSYFNQLCKFLSRQGDSLGARGKGQKLLLPIFTPGATFRWRGQRIPPDEGVAALEGKTGEAREQVWRKDQALLG